MELVNASLAFILPSIVSSGFFPRHLIWLFWEETLKALLKTVLLSGIGILQTEVNTDLAAFFCQQRTPHFQSVISVSLSCKIQTELNVALFLKGEHLQMKEMLGFCYAWQSSVKC